MPSQTITYLGARLNFVSGMVFPTDKWVSNLLVDEHHSSMSVAQSLTLHWQQLLSNMASFMDILGLCQLHMWPLECHFIVSTFSLVLNPDSIIPLPPELCPFLKW